MSSNRIRRITKELADIQKDPSSQVSAQPEGSGSDITHIKGTFLGPQGTPYEGGVYKVDIRIPNDYPFRPPSMKFETKVWHPNISSQTVGTFLSLSLFRCIRKLTLIGSYLSGYIVVGLDAYSYSQVGPAFPSIAA